MKQSEHNNKKELITAYPETKEEGESFEECEECGLFHQVVDNGECAIYYVEKLQQKDERIKELEKDAEARFHKCNCASCTDKMFTQGERIKELEAREKKLREFVDKVSRYNLDETLAWEASRCLKELGNR